MGNLLGDPTRIRERWARWFHALLNRKSSTLDLHVADNIAQWPTCASLDDSLVMEEVQMAIHSMYNRKAVGPDELPAKPIKLFAVGDQALIRQFHRIVHAI